MATPNYGYEKRQRELAKKRKNEEKKQKKQHGAVNSGPDEAVPAEGGASEPVSPDAPPPAAT